MKSTNMKKVYIAPYAEIINVAPYLSIAGPSRWDFGDAKEQTFDDENFEEDDEGIFSGWED